VSLRGADRGAIVVLGMMSKHPVAGVVWQTLHYLLGFERLGYRAYYVESGAHQPSSMLPGADLQGDRSDAAASFLDRVLRPWGLGDRWAFHALHADQRCYGLAEASLRRLYAEACLIVNLHGATLPLPEHAATGRLVYLETDPCALQLELAEGLQRTIDFLAPHVAFFTFGENYGQPACRLPVSPRFHFEPTRQPVVLDLWASPEELPRQSFTTIGNWRQEWRDVAVDGETYHWSKHLEFAKVLDLPRRTGQSFELALSHASATDQRMLEDHGWCVSDALALSADPNVYRAYVQHSLGEFTVAKDQNVRLHSGWFSDRAATYLAAGRPVVNQDTGFGNSLPTGEGLFAFTTCDEAALAVQAIAAEPLRHARAARAIAEEYFRAEVVLGRLLEAVGL
jgi:hypothetical protein